MGKSIRGEPNVVPDGTVAEDLKRIQEASTRLAVEIIVHGGPHNQLEQGLVDLSEVAGVDLRDLEKAVEEARPRLYVPRP